MFTGGPEQEWVLKGGAGLLMRLPDARFSKDLDLFRRGDLSEDDAIVDLRRLTAARPGDQLTFVIEDTVRSSSVHAVVTLTVSAYLGARYSQFTVDLSRELRLVAAPERLRPVPVVEIPDLPEMPEILLYPLPDQVADKVCAMYEVYGESQTPSSRYRDLVDLVLIVSTCRLDAAALAIALESESRRRGMVLPARMEAPAETWRSGYAAKARDIDMATELRGLPAALTLVGTCLNPILAGERDSGIWLSGEGWN